MATLKPGAALGASYRLVELLGSGAAGDVWRAERISGGEPVAAKILKPEHASDPALVERFIRERSVLIGLRHPNIVAVRDLVVEGEMIAIVMDLIPGGSLRELLDEQRTLKPADALTLVGQVFRALSEAHSRAVTHRDIKPDNVLLAAPWSGAAEDTVRVADFGIAAVVSERNRQTTGVLGTPQYMAPELISHGRTTPAADVYSAGVMLYELLSGRTPFAGPGTDFTIAYRHVTSHPPRLDLPAPIADWVARLLSKDPGERPVAADAAAEAVRLAKRFDSTAPLERAEAPTEFEEIDRPATMLRSDLLQTHADDGPDLYAQALSVDAPELGDAGQQTTVRPMPRLQAPVRGPEQDPDDAGRSRPSWLTRKNVLLGALGLVSLGGLVGGMMWVFGGDTSDAVPASEEPLEASQQDQQLPTGLSVARVATYDPVESRVALEVTYSAQKAPLSGSFLEVVPSPANGGACPPVVWEGVDAAKHQAVTGLDAMCGWRLDGVEVPADGRLTVRGSLPLEVADESELREWLEFVSTETLDSLLDPEASSTSYPVQRLVDVNVVVPSRAVGQSTLPVTLLPVWPDGPDEVHPLYQSPATGEPSRMLKETAGGEAGVRFSDSCSGAVAVSSDGLTVTTLAPTSECRIRAVVGNFTNLESAPLSITTRE